jgi:hypothetical protein
VAMLNGAVVVTAKEGSLVVENNDQRVSVAKGKTIAINPKVARSPQGGAAGGPHISSGTALQVGALAASGVSTVVGAIAVVRAGDARDSASAANSTAAAANAAASSAAAAAASSAAAANTAGCALNILAFNLGLPSPYMPPAGESCP